MVSININISNKTFYLLIGIVFLLIISGIAIAYTTDNSGQPAVMGHSSDEIEGGISFAYVGICTPVAGGSFSCTCGQGTKFMIISGNHAGPSGNCYVENQGTINVRGVCSTDSAQNGLSTFICFK